MASALFACLLVAGLQDLEADVTAAFSARDYAGAWRLVETAEDSAERDVQAVRVLTEVRDFTGALTRARDAAARWPEEPRLPFWIGWNALWLQDGAVALDAADDVEGLLADDDARASWESTLESLRRQGDALLRADAARAAAAGRAKRLVLGLVGLCAVALAIGARRARRATGC